MQRLFRLRPVKVLCQEGLGVFVRLILRQRDLLQQFLHRDMGNVESQLLHQRFRRIVAGDQPVRRRADAAELLPLQPDQRPVGAAQVADLLRHLFHIPVQDLAAAAVLVQVAQDLHRSRQGVGLPAGQDIAVAVTDLVEDLQEISLAAA